MSGRAQLPFQPSWAPGVSQQTGLAARGGSKTVRALNIVPRASWRSGGKLVMLTKTTHSCSCGSGAEQVGADMPGGEQRELRNSLSDLSVAFRLLVI